LNQRIRASSCEVAGEIEATPQPHGPSAESSCFRPPLANQARREFPPWVPANSARRMCRVKAVLMCASELTEDDCWTTTTYHAASPLSCALTASLNWLVYRKRSQPGSVRKVTDGDTSNAIRKRRDLIPADIKKMSRQITAAHDRSRASPARSLARRASRTKPVALLGQVRLTHEHLTSMMDTMRPHHTKTNRSRTCPNVRSAIDHLL